MSRYRKNNHYLTIEGEIKLLTEWAEEYGISQELIRDRLNRGWPAAKAVFMEPRKYVIRAKSTAEAARIRAAQEYQGGTQAEADEGGAV